MGLLPNGSYQVRAVSFGDKRFSGEANITVHGGAEGTVLPLAVTPPIRVNVKDEFTSDVSSGYNDVHRQQRQADYPAAEIRCHGDLGTGGRFRDAQQQQDASTREIWIPQTDSIKIERVTSGRYWVEVYPTNGYVASVTAGGTDLLHHPLVVPSGSSAPSIEVILRNDQASIEGVVEGASGLTGIAAPISSGPNSWGGSSSDSSARLYFVPLPDSAGRFSEQTVSQDGKFSVSLPPGDYRVLAFPDAQPELEYQNPVAMRVYDGKGQVVRLAAGQKEQMQLQLLSTSE